MYGCDSWTVKKAEHRRIDAFELWCWRRLLRVPWTTRRSNQSILKETSPGCSLEGLMLRLKLQYFGHLMWRVDSLEKTLMLGGIGCRRRRGWQRMRWLAGITNSMTWVWVNSASWWWTGRPGVLWFMVSQRVGHDWATELNWYMMCVSVCACSVMSDSLQPHGLYTARLLCPWDFPGRNIGVGYHFLLQGIFPTQGSNSYLLCLLHWQVDYLPLSHLGSPVYGSIFLRTIFFFNLTHFFQHLPSNNIGPNVSL